MAEKRKGKLFYSAEFVDKLCKDWMTKNEAMRLMGILPTAFRNRVKNHSIATLVIGKASLVRTDDVLRSLRQADPANG